ncbi:hypothetical protein HY469_02430 [Candidatus Roizmanbacteria bacterium]|nr:hypothetical protein [Candidatus Roizmanbacteria bacterium]
MAYEYAVIARSYVLTVFLLFCIASVYDKRFHKPLLYGTFVSLLFQTNVYSAVPAGVLVLSYCIQCWKQKRISGEHVGAFLLMGSFALFSFITYIPHPEAMNQIPPANVWEAAGSIVNNAIVSTIYVKVFPSHAFLLTPMIVVGTSIVFLAFFLSLKAKKDILFLAGTSFLWLLMTNLFLHEGTLRHYGLFLVYLLFFMWISHLRFHPVLTVCFGFLLSISVASTVYVYGMDYRYNFSGAADMADFIKRNNVLDKNIVLYAAPDGEALLPYFDTKTFWYPQIKKQTRYHINDRRALQLPWLWTDEITQSARNHFRDDSSIVYLLSKPVEENRTDFRLLHASLTQQFWGNDTEQFWLYTRTQ